MKTLMMKLKVLAAVAVGIVASGVQAIGVSDVGSTGIADDPNVGLIDRGDGTYALVFTNAQTTTFTFNSPWLVEEILVVGGGGAGGGDCGAGGGAGGLIYLTGLEYNYRAGEAFSLAVGAGGLGRENAKGQAGAHSYLTLGDDTYTAFGGGGGGQYNNGAAVAGAGGNTGSGAGGFAQADAGVSTMPQKLGYYGHDGGAGAGTDISGGGGGAGSFGHPSYGNNGGDGGDGLEVSITGTGVYYAAGGGGGAARNCSRRSSGGLGGGGNGTFEGQGRAGIDAGGYGCGGGGGSGDTSYGGNGSAGIVIVVVESASSGDRPSLKPEIVEQGANFVKFSVRLMSDGLDGTTGCEIWGGWAKNADEIVCSKIQDEVEVYVARKIVAAGLEPFSTYFYKFYAVNQSASKSKEMTGSFELSTGGLPGKGGMVTKIGGDAVHVFTASGTLSLPSTYEHARVLIVGGGAGGGIDCGGGGGAGGVVELNDFTLPSGDHIVYSGVGGQPGTAGQDSTLTIGSTVYRALGGGAGGYYGSGDTRKGKNGGSGGASVDDVTRGKSIQLSQVGLGVGHDGGLGNGNNVGGGGGGAGSDGFDQANNIGGKGGDGLVSDITGEKVVYAAGGGGGDCASGQGGVGGGAEVDGEMVANVGGHGGSQGLTEIDGVTVAAGGGFPGKSGTGSGGGGACGGGGLGTGGAGGSGVVIVRYTYTSDESDRVEPLIAFGTLAVDGTTVSVPYGISWPGKGKATCAVTLNYGPETNDLRYVVQLGAGKIGNEETALTNLIPGRRYYLQLTADNGETQGQSTIFNVTIPDNAAFPAEIAAGQPVIAGTGDPSCVRGDAETASYTGTFAQYVEGTAVTFHYSLDGETWLSDAATVTSEGFSGEVDGLTPSTDYSFYFTAEAGDFIDRTQTKKFNSMGPAVLAPAVTVSNPTREITVSGTLADVGAGDGATVRLWLKVGAGEWTECASRVMTAAGPFAFVYDGTETLAFGASVSAKVTVENTSNGGTHWQSETGSSVFTVSDKLTYTWKGGAGEWNDAANWTPSSEAVGRAGYPVYGSTAKFAESSTATVQVSRAESAARITLTGVACVRFVGVAEGAKISADVIYLSGTTRACDVTFDAIEVSETAAGQDDHNFGVAGCRFTLTNGAKYTTGGASNWAVYRQNVVFCVEKGAAFDFAAGNSFWFGAKDARTVIDDATFSTTRMFTLNDGVEDRPYIELRGAHPLLKATAGLRYEKASKGPCTIRFNIPKDGYVETPIQASGAAFPNSSDANEVVTFEIERASQFFRRPKRGSQCLVSCPSGIQTNKIVFAETYRDRGTFRYEWPTEAHTGNPTEIWLDVVAQPSFAIILR